MVGARFELEVQWSNGKTARSKERVSRIEHPSGENPKRALFAYTFEGALSKVGAVRAEREQRLEQRPGGPTRYETTEQFSGWLTAFLPLADVQEGFERHAKALQKHAQSLR